MFELCAECLSPSFNSIWPCSCEQGDVPHCKEQHSLRGRRHCPSSGQPHGGLLRFMPEDQRLWRLHFRHNWISRPWIHRYVSSEKQVVLFTTDRDYSLYIYPHLPGTCHLKKPTGFTTTTNIAGYASAIIYPSSCTPPEAGVDYYGVRCPPSCLPARQPTCPNAPRRCFYGVGSHLSQSPLKTTLP